MKTGSGRSLGPDRVVSRADVHRDGVEHCTRKADAAVLLRLIIHLCGQVLYRQADIDAYEESCLATSTTTAAAQDGARKESFLPQHSLSVRRR